MKLPSTLYHLFFLLKDSFPQSNNYLVGGCVRDFLLGIDNPKDFDIVTDIGLDDLEERIILLQKHINISSHGVGKKYFVLNIKIRNDIYEVSNFRKDGISYDGRRPSSVEIGTIEEDAKRRDFTVNALYYDPNTEKIISPINSSISDVVNKKLKFIGDPMERIKEDYLRVFRFYRFMSEKGFSPDKKSLKACRTMFKNAIINTDSERIRLEIEKMYG